MMLVKQFNLKNNRDLMILIKTGETENKKKLMRQLLLISTQHNGQNTES